PGLGRHDPGRAAHRLVVADGGEITPHPLRQRAHALALVARADHLPSERFHAFRRELPRTLPRMARRRHAWRDFPLAGHSTERGFSWMRAGATHTPRRPYS